MKRSGMPGIVKRRKKESRTDGTNIQLSRSRLQIEASRRDKCIRRTQRLNQGRGWTLGMEWCILSYRTTLEVRWGMSEVSSMRAVKARNLHDQKRAHRDLSEDLWGPIVS